MCGQLMALVKGLLVRTSGMKITAVCCGVSSKKKAIIEATAHKLPLAIHPGLPNSQEATKGSGGVTWLFSMKGERVLLAPRTRFA